MYAGRILTRFLICCFFFANSTSLFAVQSISSERIALGDYSAVFHHINEYIVDLVDEEDIAGLSIAIVNEQNIVWKKGFGFSDKKRNIKATPNTKYQVGAVTGLLTSALIMRLAEENKLNIDDNIKKHLPDLHIRSRYNDASVITIRHLLTHHAGLPINVFKHSWEKQPPSFHSLVSPSTELIASYPPETIYAFSNIGYSLLGLIAERVTGQSFSEAMEKYLLSPLGMKNSSVNNENVAVKEIAIGYKDGDSTETLLPRDTPSVGLVTTVMDLSYFVRQYFGEKTPHRDGLDEMIRIQNENIELDIGRQVGFSWFVGGMNVKNAGPVIWRGGATPYHRSCVAMLPEHKLAVVILSNDGESWKAIEKIAEEILRLMVAAKSGVKQPERGEQIEDNVKVELAADHNRKKDTFANAYSGFIGHIEIKPESDDKNYHAKIIGWPFVLSQDVMNPDWYTLKYDLFGFIPIDISWIAGVKVQPAVINQHRVLIVYYKSRQYLFAQRFEKKLIHQNWKTMVGEYQVKNTDVLLESMKVKSIVLKIKNNALFFIYRLPFFFGLDLEVPLNTLSNTEAIISGLGTGLNETVSIRMQNGKAVLVYSGYVLENTLYEK